MVIGVMTLQDKFDMIKIKEELYQMALTMGLCPTCGALNGKHNGDCNKSRHHIEEPTRG